MIAVQVMRSLPREHGYGNDELVQRLWGWGTWARIDPDRPDDSCVNPIWSNFCPSDSDRQSYGWGEPAPVEADPIDVADAEAVDCLVRQVARAHQIVLIKRFVLRLRVSWRDVDPAVRAVQDLIEANWRVVRRMESES